MDHWVELCLATYAKTFSTKAKRNPKTLEGEIDLLPWSAVKLERGVIRIQRTEHFDSKTEHSVGDCNYGT